MNSHQKDVICATARQEILPAFANLLGWMCGKLQEPEATAEALRIIRRCDALFDGDIDRYNRLYEAHQAWVAFASNPVCESTFPAPTDLGPAGKINTNTVSWCFYLDHMARFYPGWWGCACPSLLDDHSSPDDLERSLLDMAGVPEVLR